MRRFAHSDRGTTVVEYGLLLALITVIIVAAIGMGAADVFRQSTHKLCLGAFGTSDCRAGGTDPIEIPAGGGPIPSPSPSPCADPSPSATAATAPTPTATACATPAS